MALIVGVHGIAQQFKGPESLLQEWLPALRDGLHAAGEPARAEGLLQCASYGELLFRPAGHVRAAGAPIYRPEDLDEDEAALLMALWRQAAISEPDRVVAPDAAVRGTPKLVQQGLRALSRSRFFVGVAESAMISNFKQVRAYLRDPVIRRRAQAQVHEAMTPDTRVLIGHSLGSVVAYEALHTYAGDPGWAGLKSLVTLGSPLGIPNLIFDALIPAPVKGKGVWPARIQKWTNISDDGDVVALEKRLGSRFDGGELIDIAIDNGAKAHDIRPYLSARQTGEAIGNALV